MPSQYTKLSVQRHLNEQAFLHAIKVIQGTGRSLPCRVTAVNGSVVTVAFEANQPYMMADGTIGTYTLPPLTLPKAESQWLRAPTQIGDLGVTRPVDTFVGGVSGLGSGVANTGVNYGNMTALVWEPVANINFVASPDPNKAYVNGPNGTRHSDSAGKFFHEIDATAQHIKSQTAGALQHLMNDVTQEIAHVGPHVNLGDIGANLTTANAVVNNHWLGSAGYDGALQSAKLSDYIKYANLLNSAGTITSGQLVTILAALVAGWTHGTTMTGIGSAVVNAKS